MSGASRPKWQFWLIVSLVIAVVVVGSWAFVYPYAPFLHPGKVRVVFSIEAGCSMKGARLDGNRLMLDARLVWVKPGIRRFTAILDGESFEQDVEIPSSGGEMLIFCDPRGVTIRTGR